MFFDRFVEKCNSKGISPTAAVIELGFNKSQVTRWRTSTPRKASLLKIANYFGCTVDELLDEDEKNKPTANAVDLDENQIKLLEILPQLSPDAIESLLQLALVLVKQGKSQDGQ